MNNNNPLRSFLRNIIRSYHDISARENAQNDTKYIEEKVHKGKELKWVKNGVLVNAILVFISALVCYITIQQAIISSDAVTIASKALKHQIESDSLNDARDLENFSLQQKSLMLSVEALNQSKQRFSAEHENFLEIRDYRVDFTDVAKYPNIMFSMFNYGSIVLVKEARYAYDGGAAIDSVYLKEATIKMLNKAKFEYSPNYIGQQTPQSKTIEWNVVGLQTFKKITDDSFIFYFFGEVKYSSLINKKEMILKFKLSTKVINKVSYKILSIKNEEDKGH